LIVSRRNPIRDGLRRALSGDSPEPGAIAAAVGGQPSRGSFCVALADLFGDPDDLELGDAAVLGSACAGAGPAPADVFESVGNL